MSVLDTFLRAPENGEEVYGYTEYNILMDQMRDPCSNSRDCLAVFHSKQIEFDKESTNKMYMQVFEYMKDKFDVEIDFETEKLNDAIYLLYRFIVVNLIPVVTTYLYETIKDNFEGKNREEFLRGYSSPDYKDSGSAHGYDEYNLMRNISKICEDVSTKKASFNNIVKTIMKSSKDEKNEFFEMVHKYIKENIISATDLMSDMYSYLKESNLAEAINLKVLFMLWENGTITAKPLETYVDEKEEDSENVE